MKQGGKATTANEVAEQLELFRETADNPRGNVAGAALSQLDAAPRAEPKSRTTTRKVLPAMKIMEEVANERNLRVAFANVAANKGAPCVDRQTIEEVRKHFEKIVPVLRRELLDGSYRPGMIRRVWIPKPGGRRGLGIPNVIDRIVQQAVHQVLSPIYEPTFHESSHGFRPERSCHTAIAEAKKYVEEGHGWIVDLDLEAFFDRVPHQRLVARLEQRIGDRRVILLIHRMLKVKVVMPDGVVVKTTEGAPQGGPLSPLLSNVVLDELDWELEQRGLRFVRYADDCNIYVRSRRAGERVMASIARFIEGRLRLKINQKKSAVDRPANRHFVGFRLQPHRGRVQVRLSKRSQTRLAEKIRELTPRSWGQSLEDCISDLNAYLRGWIGFFGICDREERFTLREMDSHIRRRLRAIVLKQWRRPRSILRRLIRKGVDPSEARRDVYGGCKSLWRLSACPSVHRGLRNAYFARRGLLSLEAEWHARHPEVFVAPIQLWLDWRSCG